MPSSYQMKIRQRKKQEFANRQRRNQIVGLLNQEYTALRNANPNMTAEQIFAQQAAGYVVKDTDTLESIASANGVDVTNVLDANPELKNLQTGMVINTPRPGSEAWRVQNAYKGGMGLPSNAAIGAAQGSLSTFQEEKQYRPPSAFQQEKQYRPPNPFAQREAETFAALNRNALQANSLQNRPQPAGQTWIQKAASMAGPLRTQNSLSVPYRGSIAATALAAQQQFQQATQSAPTPLATQPTRPVASTHLPSTYPGGFRRWVGEEMAQINSPDYTPNEVTLKYLEKLGLIKPTKPQTSFGGGGFSSYGRGRRGGGGGRGKGRGGGAVQQGERLPAFSQGTGNMGLINWRI